MESEEYPKIETLLVRDPKTFKVLEGKLRFPEFGNVKEWYVTEKIDGMNVRVTYRMGRKMTGRLGALAYEFEYTNRKLEFNSRHEEGSLPPFLVKYLEEIFTLEKFSSAFTDLKPETDVVLYGEGYGPKIQSGGNYRKDISFRLFDVKVGEWWLEPPNIADVAAKLGIKTVPCLGLKSVERVVDLIKLAPRSIVSEEEGGDNDHKMEGIVARTVPLLLRRDKSRLMFKLKRKDFG